MWIAWNFDMKKNDNKAQNGEMLSKKMISYVH